MIQQNAIEYNNVLFSSNNNNKNIYINPKL